MGMARRLGPVRVLALFALVSVDGSLQQDGAQQHVMSVPADLVHPSQLPTLAADSFESLVEHGRALARYGQKLAVYARPACEVAAYFMCYDTSESSHESIERWLPRAIGLLEKAVEMRPGDSEAQLALIDAHLSVSNLSAALDLYERRWLHAETALPPDAIDAHLRAHVLIRVHVLGTRNCLWAETARAHLRISGLLRVPNATIPAMHLVEIPGVSGEQFLQNIQALNRGIEAELAADMATLTAQSMASRQPKRRKRKQRGARKLTLGYVSSSGFRASTSSRALLGLFLARSRRLFRVVCFAGEGNDSSPQRAVIRENCDEFVEAAGWSPAKLAREVRRHDIDLLVDLLGVASGAALAGLAAFRQAPLQISFHGQPFTTGSRCGGRARAAGWVVYLRERRGLVDAMTGRHRSLWH